MKEFIKAGEYIEYRNGEKGYVISTEDPFSKKSAYPVITRDSDGFSHSHTGDGLFIKSVNESPEDIIGPWQEPLDLSGIPPAEFFIEGIVWVAGDKVGRWRGYDLAPVEDDYHYAGQRMYWDLGCVEMPTYPLDRWRETLTQIRGIES